jgi:hypothetical protein
MLMNVMHALPQFQAKGSHRPATNTERQAAFRRRNPGYYQRLHAKRKAECLARVAQLAAVEQMPAPVLLTLPLPTWRLALPAPVVDPLLLEINALAEQLANTRVAQTISRPTTPGN